MRIASWIKYKIYRYVPIYVWELLATSTRHYKEIKYLEQKKTYGDLNSDKTFYVIRRKPPAYGFFSNFLHVCQGLIYADQRGYIPVVDMENYWIKELSSVRKINNTYNAWCYFFEQTSDFSLKEVYNSKNVILSAGSELHGKKHWLNTKTANPIETFKNIDQLKSVIDKYIQLNDETKLHIDQVKSTFQWQSEKTLGLFVRGAVYNHSIVATFFHIPKLEEIFLECENLMKQNKINSIFIVTEDFLIYKKLCMKFKHYNVIPSLRFKSDMTETKWLSNQKLTWDGAINMGYDLTLIYLTEMLLLSSCEFTVGTYSNATVFSSAYSDLIRGSHKIILPEETIDINSLLR